MAAVPKLVKGWRHLLDMARTSPAGNARQWLEDRHISLYTRIGNRLVEDKLQRVLMLATISVHERHQRKGRMRDTFAAAEAFVDSVPELDGVYVESVLNEVIPPFLLARGYVHLPETDPLHMGLGDYYRRSK